MIIIYNFVSVTLNCKSTDFLELINSFNGLEVPRGCSKRLIVINQSKDGLATEGKTDDIYIHNTYPSRICLSKARNMALKLIESGYTVFCDDDATYPADFLVKMHDELVRNNCPTLCYFTLCVLGRNGLAYGNRRYPNKSGYVTALRAIFNCISLNMVCDIALINKAGCFDERIGAGTNIACGEETDLLLRMMACSAKPFFINGVFAFHPAIESVADDFKTLAYLAGYKQMLFMKPRGFSASAVLIAHYFILVLGICCKLLDKNSRPIAIKKLKLLLGYG